MPDGLHRVLTGFSAGPRIRGSGMLRTQYNAVQNPTVVTQSVVTQQSTFVRHIRPHRKAPTHYTRFSMPFLLFNLAVL